MNGATVRPSLTLPRFPPHIHFHLTVEGRNGFFVPAIFSPEVVQQFHAKWDGFGKDDDTPIPPCIGYRIGAEENPFGTGAEERL